MTREEAIAYGKECLSWNEFSKNMKMYQFIEMAIQALSQEPCDDAVSRADAIEALTGWETEATDEEIEYTLNKLPSVTVRQTQMIDKSNFDVNQYKIDIDTAYECGKASVRQTGKWIPVSERLPEKSKQVLCCNKNGSVFTSAITYINSNGMVAFGQHYEVIAWMPLPEPYEPQEGANE